MMTSSGVRFVEPAAAAGFEVSPLPSTAELPAVTWDRLARRGFHRHCWFAAAEASGLEPRHLIVRDGGGARAIIPAYLERAALHGDLHDRWWGPARLVTGVLGPRLRPTLAVVLPFGSASEPLGDVESLPAAVVERVFERLEAQARADGAVAVAWPFVSPAQPRVLRAAARRGYTRAFAGSTAAIDVAWPDFETYLATRGKSVRRTIRKELAVLERDGLRVETTTDFRAAAGELDALYRAAFRRRNGHPPVLERDFFGRVAATPDAGIRAQLVHSGGRIIGMSLNLEAGGVVDGCFSAFAPGFEVGPAYFDDLIYTPLRIACTAGFRRLELGPTALYAKRLRGAELYPRTTLVRGLSPGAHAIVSALGFAVGRWTRRKERRTLRPHVGRGRRPGGRHAARRPAGTGAGAQ